MSQKTMIEDQPAKNPTTEVYVGDQPTKKPWHPRVEMRWRQPPSAEPAVLEQLWQCQQTGELWWRSVPRVVGWESSEP